MVNSRQKGARGERLLAKYLTEHGFPAKRGCQFRGGTDSPDVKCSSLRKYHFECKFTERLELQDAMSQARRDAGNKIPMVAHKRNGEEWLLIMSLKDFLEKFARFYKEENGEDGL